MANDRVTLSIKGVDQGSKVSTTNLMYVNPDATDSQLQALAERTVALTDDTLVSSSRIETREIPFYTGTQSRGLLSYGNAQLAETTTVVGNVRTFTKNSLWSTSLNMWIPLCLGFQYNGTGKMYIKSEPANFPFMFKFVYDITVPSGGTFINRAGVYPSVLLFSGGNLFMDNEEYTDTGNLVWEGDVVLALDGDDTYEYTEHILRFPDMSRS